MLEKKEGRRAENTRHRKGHSQPSSIRNSRDFQNYSLLASFLLPAPHYCVLLLDDMLVDEIVAMASTAPDLLVCFEISTLHQTGYGPRFESPYTRYTSPAERVRTLP